MRPSGQMVRLWRGPKTCRLRFAKVTIGEVTEVALARSLAAPVAGSSSHLASSVCSIKASLALLVQAEWSNLGVGHQAREGQAWTPTRFAG